MERKLATVLFVDLVDSTSLVAGTDPEVARRRVGQFFERVSHCVTTHGGIVEKFAGDAVLAAFGVPQAHEDDAERAIRAALAMLESVGELGLGARVGVESGEVVVDESDSTFATGEAVTLAARLQQAAGAGEVLIGPHAYRLTSDRVQTEDVGPLDVKGFGDRIWTWRAKGVLDEVIPRRLAAPLVGRESELELLQNTYERAVRNRRAHLFTIYGDPGVGKSRLAREFVEGLEGATVLVGRSLPYGESVTYWPLAEMVKAAAGITDDDPLDVAVEKLRESCENEAIADLLGLASGVLEAVKGERSQQEIAWAAREWVERMAQDQPLVLAFEDIHWAEDALLDLIEHLAEWVRDAPLLILGLARAELLDVRPGWGGGRLRATAIELEPLGRKESEELVDALASKGGIEADARSALLDKTEGNPLFVEETMRMLAECEGRPLSEFASRIPDTLQALIAARIDRLPPDEKAVLQRASVIGRTFWGGAIADLTPAVEELESVLETLLLREFLVPDSRPRGTGRGHSHPRRRRRRGGAACRARSRCGRRKRLRAALRRAPRAQHRRVVARTAHRFRGVRARPAGTGPGSRAPGSREPRCDRPRGGAHRQEGIRPRRAARRSCARAGGGKRLDRRARERTRLGGRLGDLTRRLRRGSAKARGSPRVVRGDRRRLVVGPRALQAGRRCVEPGGPRTCRAPEPGVDPDAGAARGPRHSLRGAAAARRGPPREGQGRRGRAVRRGGTRHRRPAGHELAGVDPVYARPRPERAGAVRRVGETAPGSGGHHRPDGVPRLRVGFAPLPGRAAEGQRPGGRGGRLRAAARGRDGGRRAKFLAALRPGSRDRPESLRGSPGATSRPATR